MRGPSAGGIVEEVKAHPRRELIEAIADATFYNEEGQGAGMWWHLSQAYALAETLPALTLRAEMAAELAAKFRGIVSRCDHDPKLQRAYEMAALVVEEHAAAGTDHDT